LGDLLKLAKGNAYAVFSNMYEKSFIMGIFHIPEKFKSLLLLMLYILIPCMAHPVL